MEIISVLIAAISTMIIGFIWYSQQLFGKIWMQLTGIHKLSKKEMEKDMGQIMGINIVLAVATAMTLKWLLEKTGASTMTEALPVIFACWLAFTAATKFSDLSWEKRPLMIGVINSGYRLVSFVVMAMILFILN